MNQTATNRIVTIKLDGEGIVPEAMGQDLLRVLNSCWALAKLSGDDQCMGIQSIENNCVLIKFVVGIGMSALVLFGQGETGDASKRNAEIEAINKIAKDRCLTISVTDSLDPDFQVQYSAASPIPQVEETREIVNQCMNIYGELTDVGGKTPNIHIHSRRQEQSICLSISKEDARKVANRLYGKIGVYARVTTVDDVITKGEVLEVLDYDPVEPHEWMRNLPEWFSRPWKDVNLDEYMKSLRDDGRRCRRGKSVNGLLRSPESRRDASAPCQAWMQGDWLPSAGRAAPPLAHGHHPREGQWHSCQPVLHS